MTAITALSTADLSFFSSSRCLYATHRFRRREEVFVLSPFALAPLRLLRHSLGLLNGRKRRGRGNAGWVLAGEGFGENHDLEEDIYEFMQMSANPMAFPSKEDLVAAGREDLVRAIAKEKGWMAFGWDSDEEIEVPVDGISDGVCKRPIEGGSTNFQHKVNSVAGLADASLTSDSNILSSWEDSSGASSSGRQMDRDADDTGIEGILTRLEKERSLAFGFVPRKEEEVMFEKEENISMMSRGNALDNADSWNIGGNGRPVSLSLQEGSHHHSRSSNSYHGPSVDVNNDSEPGSWRAWSIQRSGDPLTNFEAAEIVLDEEQIDSNLDFASHLVTGKEKKYVSDVELVTGASNINSLPYDNDQGFLKDNISMHLQYLESQLTSTLEPFKYRINGVSSNKNGTEESLLKELHKLSDALEFQQNEIKKARDMLRSTRAKIAVIEGKIALEVIESQKNIEEKQTRLHAAEKALCILRDVLIVWPKSASDVLLVGSFDGWTSQRRMEKKDPTSMMFSLCLKLYPGRYEIKFIVDGVWTVDQLLPIVNNNGFQNNLLTVA